MVCAVTGSCPTEVLQAAHIRRFAEHETHELDEGVLLRAEIHLLFDNGQFVIDPDTWQVVLAPSLAGYEAYAGLAGPGSREARTRTCSASTSRK
jgi:predicted restriction endonuclease